MVQTQLAETPFSTLSDEYITFKQLSIMAIIMERKILLDLRKNGEIHDEIFRKLSGELDLEEIRVKSLRI